MKPATASEHRPSRTGRRMPPSASTSTRRGVSGNAMLKSRTARANTWMGNITSSATASSGSSPPPSARAFPFSVPTWRVIARASATSAWPSRVSTG